MMPPVSASDSPSIPTRAPSSRANVSESATISPLATLIPTNKASGMTEESQREAKGQLRPQSQPSQPQPQQPQPQQPQPQPQLQSQPQSQSQHTQHSSHIDGTTASVAGSLTSSDTVSAVVQPADRRAGAVKPRTKDTPSSRARFHKSNLAHDSISRGSSSTSSAGSKHANQLSSAFTNRVLSSSQNLTNLALTNSLESTPVDPPLLHSKRKKKPPAEVKKYQGIRVLVAEDNVVNQRIVTRMLASHGFDVDVVGNGRVGACAFCSYLIRIAFLDSLSWFFCDSSLIL